VRTHQGNNDVIMGQIKKIIPLNRVEGDLEIQLEIQDGVVREASSVGTMYRGIENLMRGRGPMDSLVITPRICGICTTAHLNAAAEALDMAYAADVPDNGRRLRNVTLMVEQLQNDIRHAFLLFMPDLIHPRYASHPLYGEAFSRYQVLRGHTAQQTVKETKKLLEIIAILGGQWPHSSFMVPGGVVSVPMASDIIHCRNILRNFRKWYEERILGCSLDRWRQIDSWDDIHAWLAQRPAHTNSEVGFFIRYGLGLGLDALGRGHDTFISYGGPHMPRRDRPGFGAGNHLCSAPAFFTPEGAVPLDPDKISEDITCSYFQDDQAARHPFDGRTAPCDADTDEKKYSWAKAPRYAGRPAETGALADMLVAEHPLFVEKITHGGANVLIRQLARLVRPVNLLLAIDRWLAEMIECKSPFFQHYTKAVTARSCGLVSAPRGALGHWMTIENGVIANYQVITPTAWNASPRDVLGVRGPWEEAIVGTEIPDPDHPIEVEQIVRSFDPCLVCTVHAVKMH
jgi:Ni,Fe-hydrogenase I large subunit